MIGTLNLDHREAVVVGAGISGLLSAYALDKAGFEVTLIEKNPSAGGLIETTQHPKGMVESAAHSFLATQEVQKLCGELGVPLVAVNPDSKARFVLRGGRMRRFPLTARETMTAFVRAYFILSRGDVSRGTATLEDWATRHLGSAALSYLVSPFLTGIYAARPSEICLSAAFPGLEIPPGHSFVSHLLRKKRLALLGQRNGRSGARQMMAPLHGMGALTSALSSHLEDRLGRRFEKGVELAELPKTPNLILATPAFATARLLEREDAELSAALREIRYAPLITATIFVPVDAFLKVPRGVGVLFPETEKRKSLGILFNSSAFPGRVSSEAFVSLTMMLGGTLQPELLAKSDSELHAIVRDELSAVFSFRRDRGSQEAEIILHRWPSAIPFYNASLGHAWTAARRGWCRKSGRLLAGNYTGQVSLRGMIQDADAMGSRLAAGLHV